MAALDALKLSGKLIPETMVYKASDGHLDIAGWIQTVFSPRGRPMRHIAPPMFVVVLVAVLKCLACEDVPRGLMLQEKWHYQCETSEVLKEVYPMLLVALSFLLVFRLNRAAVRYYESRAAYGKLIATCRTMAGMAATYFAHDPAARDELCKWIVVYSSATRNYLQLGLREGAGSAGSAEELIGILSEKEAADLERSPVQSMYCLGRLRGEVLEATRRSPDNQYLAASVFQTFETHIDELNFATGAMERINNTPLPFAHVAHMRTLLVAYLVGIPFAIGSEWGWGTVGAVVVFSYALLGIEAAAVACERPFGKESNHLPMNTFSNAVVGNVSQILREEASRRPSAIGGRQDVRTNQL